MIAARPKLGGDFRVRKEWPVARRRRRLTALLAALVGLLAWLVPATPAAAAPDTFDVWDVRYTIRPDGILEVQEAITLRFGSSSGRHGLERYLVTREPYDDKQDIRYEVANVRVTSPDARVSTAVSESAYIPAPREEVRKIRVGSPSRTITADAATYKLSYQVRGALRAGADDLPELYWDVTGPDIGDIVWVTVAVDAPGGVRDVACSVAPDGQSGPCEVSRIDDGRAQFSHGPVPRGQIMTIGAQLDAGAVSDATPLLVERADADEIRGRNAGIGIGIALVLGMPLAGWLIVRRRTGDDRYLDLPPGVVPGAGETARVGRSPQDVEIPVAFSPPRIPIAQAGYLLDGHYDIRHLSAALVDLAVRGAVELTSGSEDQAKLADRTAVAGDEAAVALLGDVFPAQRTKVRLSEAASLTRASENLSRREELAAQNNGWFRSLGLGRSEPVLQPGILLAAGVLVALLVFTPTLHSLWPVLLGAGVVVAVGAVTVMLARRRLRTGRRTAHGRALTDQIEGFRTYIATAEAEQLRFEEGEDNFTRYLPWAVLFGETEHWIAVCRRAVELGRIPEPRLAGFGDGTWQPQAFTRRINTLTRSVGSGVKPPPPPPSSGPSFRTSSSGRGRRSAFSGRSSGGRSGGGGSARSGGGGGGGGAGSW